MAQTNIGLGETVITPREPVQMRGFARSQVSTGTHDDLHARCLWIESGDQTVVFLSISLCGLTSDYADAIRAGISRATGTHGDHVIISCTHTHAGPNVGGSHDTFNKEEVEASIAPLAYREFLVQQCVDSAVQAWTRRAPGRLGIGTTEAREVGRNRRTLHYGGVHPDPEVAVIRTEDAEGKLTGVVFNYGCHPSALDWQNTLFSEDWPYYAIRDIRQHVGTDVWVAFLQAAQGNINVGYQSELSAVGVDMPVRSYAYIEQKGAQMAAAVLGVLDDIPTTTALPVEVACDHFEYPLRASYPVSIEEARVAAEGAAEALRAAEADPGLQGTRRLDDVQRRVFQTEQRLRAAERFYGMDERPATRRLEQQAARIGDSLFVTFPGELFSEIGLAIKQQSPATKTFIVGVTCGPGGYLPSAAEFREGDYEVDGSAYSPETEAVCVAASVELLQRVSQKPTA